MELTTRGRYAVMAMAELARQEPGRACPLSQIADLQKLPLPYLEQLFLSLRRAGLVESARGRSGGYKLARAGAEISIADIMAAVEEDTHFTRCTQEHGAAGCQAGERCITHGLWSGLSQVTAGYLAAATLADVVSGTLPSTKPAAAPQTLARTARHYLDYNATAPLRPQARTAMIAALDVVGNPSSVHAEGRRARGVVETAREQVAALVGAKPSEVVFTSGASEANAWVLAQPFDTVFMSGIEHDSVLANASLLPLPGTVQRRVIDLPAGRDGLVRIEDVARHVLTRTDLGARVLVTLQMANNETGALQSVAELAHFAHEHGLFMHTDAVQAAGRVAIDFASLPVTALSLSAHKIGGPKGVGALIIRDRVDLVPFLRGGGQERRRRAGTENVAAIAGFGAAAEAAHDGIAGMARLAALRDRFETGLRAIVPQAVVVAQETARLANTSCVALPGRSSESLIIKLDLSGISVSAGSACSSGKVGASHVLAAMGLDSEIAQGAIRISLGHETDEHEIAAILAALKTIAGQPALAA